jgi:hypothetical protein
MTSTASTASMTIPERGRRISDLSHTIDQLGNLNTALAHASVELRQLGFTEESKAVDCINRTAWDRGLKTGDEHEEAVKDLDLYVGSLVGQGATYEVCESCPSSRADASPNAPAAPPTPPSPSPPSSPCSKTTTTCNPTGPPPPSASPSPSAGTTPPPTARAGCACKPRASGRPHEPCCSNICPACLERPWLARISLRVVGAGPTWTAARTPQPASHHPNPTERRFHRGSAKAEVTRVDSRFLPRSMSLQRNPPFCSTNSACPVRRSSRRHSAAVAVETPQRAAKSAAVCSSSDKAQRT